MKSPFPGMDPYIEQYWRDVHSRLIIYACDQIQGHLPGSLYASVEECVYVEVEETEQRSTYPDVRVVEHGKNGGVGIAAQGGIAVAEPYVLHLGDEPVTETLIEIREAGSGNRIITVIEFLSPTNKTPGEGQDLYRQKQEELRAARVSLVEVDLLRAGRRVYSISPHQIPAHIRTPYQIVARRGWEWMKAEVYAMPLRERLPIIRIPLRQADKDVPLDVQALVDLCNSNGRFEYRIDYQSAADPPLEGHDAEWADALLRQAGKRK